MKNTVTVLALITILFGCSSEKNPKEDKSFLPSSWSSAKVVSLCDSPEFSTATQEMIRDYDGRTYYNKQVEKSNNEINVSFDFISDCCQEFEIDYQIIDDRLIIVYSSKTGTPCDCKCDYRGIVNIGDKQVDFDEIIRVTIKEGG